ncbi:hypothetical protein G7Y89_g11098 [Cudoniella acicularis]|uniref:Uncharacterized protein n=1 Tax=Cudoniella acicularis TaxID=354080 RepID=A0A8H4RCZ7_9HELO|nr:hypothetical protein G7Y89_g11098 [Cudoniella acicularis]
MRPFVDVLAGRLLAFSRKSSALSTRILYHCYEQGNVCDWSKLKEYILKRLSFLLLRLRSDTDLAPHFSPHQASHKPAESLAVPAQLPSCPAEGIHTFTTMSLSTLRTPPQTQYYDSEGLLLPFPDPQSSQVDWDRFIDFGSSIPSPPSFHDSPSVPQTPVREPKAKADDTPSTASWDS